MHGLPGCPGGWVGGVQRGREGRRRCGHGAGSERDCRGVCGADRSKEQQVGGETGWSRRRRLGLTLPGEGGAVPQGSEFPFSVRGLGRPSGFLFPL